MMNNRTKCRIFKTLTLLALAAFAVELVRPFFGDDFYGWEAVFILMAMAVFLLLWRNYRRAVRLGNIYGPVYRRIGGSGRNRFY